MNDPFQTPQIFLSRNEAEGLATKAARGAGLPWGTAEEAGFAIGWLHAAGIDGLTPLLAHLRVIDHATWKEMYPKRTNGVWQDRANCPPLCPIAFGMILSDFAGLDDFDEGFAKALAPLNPVAFPVLTLPFFASLAASRECDVSIQFNDLTVAISATAVLVRETEVAVLEGMSGAVISGLRQERTHKTCEAKRPHTSPNTLSGLELLALKTTVPPSDRSREDAGSGATDND